MLYSTIIAGVARRWRAMALLAAGVALVTAIPMAVGDSKPYRGTCVLVSPTETTRIEAENYDLGGEGVAYHEKTPDNWGRTYRVDEPVDLKRVMREPGHFSLCATEEGEWVNYSIQVAREGKYRLRMRTARPPSEQPGKVRVSLGGESQEFVVHGQGGFNRLQEEDYGTFDLSAGPHVLRLEFVTGGTDVDWMELVHVAPAAEMTSATVPATTP